MANCQISITHLERIAFPSVNPLSRSFSARNPPFCCRPIFGIVLTKSSKEARALGFCTADSSISEAAWEKEVKFTPAFGDYVKVLESIQSDRSKNRSGDSDGVLSDSNPRTRGTDTPRKTKKNDTGVLRSPSRNTKREDKGAVALKKHLNAAENDVSKSEKILLLRERHKGNGYVGKHSERVYAKASMATNWVNDDDDDDDDDDYDEGEMSLKKHLCERSSKIAGEYKGRLKKKLWNGEDHVLNKDKNLLHKEVYNGKHLERVYSKAFMINNKVDDDDDDDEGEVSLKKHLVKRSLKKAGEDRGRLKKKLWNGENHVSNRDKNLLHKEVYKGNGSLGKHSERVYSRASKFSNSVKVDDEDADDDERAAFKTFEVFTDIRNRPRVLRMELEERIQNLANRLNAADINIPEWKFSRMMHSEKIKFTDHSVLRVIQLLGKFGNWRRVLHVVEWVQSHQPFESYKSRYIYTTVLSVLGKAKRPVEALNVFYSMRKEIPSYPDLAAYHCIAVTLGQAGMMKELFDVIDCMRSKPENKFKLGMLQNWDPRLEPDLVVFNAVLNACVQEKQWEGAFWVLQELKTRGIKPTNTTYGLIMEVMLVCGKYNLVYEFFNKIQKTSVPGALSYKVLVNTFWREGKVDEAVLAVKEMESRGIVGSASLYYDLARCLCSKGRCQEALQLIHKLSKVAQKPLVVTYTGLIQACLDSESIDNAAYVFNQMSNFCNPNLVTCNIMLKSYKERGMFFEARNLFQMILKGDELIGMKKIIPDNFTFNTMLDACVEAEKWNDFEHVYEKMLEYGLPFNARRHLRMVMEASRAGKVKLLDITYHHLIESGRTPPPAILSGRLSLAAT